MFTLALVIATAREGTVRAFVSRATTVKRWGGRVMLIVGGWFIIVAIFARLSARFFSV
jgi:hypothetical protein